MHVVATLLFKEEAKHLAGCGLVFHHEDFGHANLSRTVPPSDTNVRGLVTLAGRRVLIDRDVLMSL
jgi:hypothetical protein